jgi:predicted nucleic acid-binding protein
VNVYCDTSFVVALRVQRDTLHEAAVGAYETLSRRGAGASPRLLVSDWTRIETCNVYRQASQRRGGRGPAISRSEAKALLLDLDRQLATGFFVGWTCEWTEVRSHALVLAAEHGFRIQIRSADLLHLAFAKVIMPEALLCLDDRLADAAETVGFSVVRRRRG